MKKTYKKPIFSILGIASVNIMATSAISPEIPEDDERVDAIANKTVFEDFDELADTDGLSSYEQKWNSNYNW